MPRKELEKKDKSKDSSSNLSHAKVQFDRRNTVSLHKAVNIYNCNADVENTLNSAKSRLTTLQTSSYKGSLFSGMGSTFFTNNTKRIRQTHDAQGKVLPSYTLDASFSTLLPDEGTILAIADGNGGHQGNELQDETIAYLSHCATKAAAQILYTYSDPVKLENDIKVGKVTEAIKEAVIKRLAQKADGKFSRFVESITLACARTFKTGDGLKVVGFSIGDSMIIAWNSTSKSFMPLAYSRRKVLDKNKEITALFPAYSQDDIQTFSSALHPDSMVLGFTNFITKHLPSENWVTENNKIKWRDTMLDAVFMIKLLSSLPATATSGDVGQLIIQTSFVRAQDQLADIKKRAQGFIAEQALLELKLADMVKNENGIHKKSSPECGLAMARLEELAPNTHIEHGDDVGIVVAQPYSRKY